MEFRKMVMITLYAKHTALIKITKGLSFLGAARGHQTSSQPHSAVQPVAFFIRLWGWPLCCLLLSFSSFWHQPPKDASLSIHPHPVFLVLLHSVLRWQGRVTMWQVLCLNHFFLFFVTLTATVMSWLVSLQFLDFPLTEFYPAPEPTYHSFRIWSRSHHFPAGCPSVLPSPPAPGWCGLGVGLVTVGHPCLHLQESDLAHLSHLSLEELSEDPPLDTSISPLEPADVANVLSMLYYASSPCFPHAECAQSCSEWIYKDWIWKGGGVLCFLGSTFWPCGMEELCTIVADDFLPWHPTLKVSHILLEVPWDSLQFQPPCQPQHRPQLFSSEHIPWLGISWRSLTQKLREN